MHTDRPTKAAPRPLWPEFETVDPGTMLFDGDEPARDVVWIVEGLIKLVDSHRHGRPATLGLRRGESLLGSFTAPSLQVPYTNAIAVSETRFCRFDANHFREHLASPAFLLRARDVMCRTLLADLEDYTRGFLQDPEQRLAAVLSIFADRQDTTASPAQVSLPREITAADLADLLGVTASQLTGLSSIWRRAGHLHAEDGYVFNQPALDRAAVCQPSVFLNGAPDGCGVPLRRLRVPADARVAKAIAVIEAEHANAALGLRDVSREVHVSPWHLSRLLKRSTGATFRQLLTMVRVERARVALLTTQLSIKEIAASAGFNYLSDLTRRFRVVHNASPTAYRSHMREAGLMGLGARDRHVQPRETTSCRA